MHRILDEPNQKRTEHEKSPTCVQLAVVNSSSTINRNTAGGAHAVGFALSATKSEFRVLALNHLDVDKPQLHECLFSDMLGLTVTFKIH